MSLNSKDQQLRKNNAASNIKDENGGVIDGRLENNPSPKKDTMHSVLLSSVVGRGDVNLAMELQTVP